MHRLRLALTRLYIKFYLRGKVLGTKVVVPNSRETKGVEVTIFAKKDVLFIGQATLFGTIIIEESVLSQYGLMAQEYVLTHEYAHTRQKSKYVILPAMFWVVFKGASFFTTSGGAFLLLLLTRRFEYLRLLTANAHSFILYLFLFCALSWILEGLADFYAIERLGRTQILEARRELRIKNPNRRLSHRVIGRLTHPPIEVTLRFFDLLHGRNS